MAGAAVGLVYRLEETPLPGDWDKARTQIAYTIPDPGPVRLEIFDVLREFDIRCIRTEHEQGAVHAADGYARVTGKVGVCMATSGPGATNLVTSIADAKLDSVPMIAITGTNGKTTTTELAAHLYRSAGRPVAAAGNHPLTNQPFASEMSGVSWNFHLITIAFSDNFTDPLKIIGTFKVEATVMDGYCVDIFQLHAVALHPGPRNLPAGDHLQIAVRDADLHLGHVLLQGLKALANDHSERELLRRPPLRRRSSSASGPSPS